MVCDYNRLCCFLDGIALTLFITSAISNHFRREEEAGYYFALAFVIVVAVQIISRKLL